MAFDKHKNFAGAVVLTPPSPAVSGTSLTVDDSSLFPLPPFNATLWPAEVFPTYLNAEIVRVTAINSGVLTIQRTQESTLAVSVIAGYLIAATVTAKSLEDIETALGALVTGVSSVDGATGAVVLSSVYAPLSHTHSYLPMGGGTLTGALTLSGAPTQNLHAATKLYVDSVLPSQTGNSGKVLTTDGSIVSWASVAAGGVTSVDGRTGAVTLSDLYSAIGHTHSGVYAPVSHAATHVTGGSDVIANAIAGGAAGLMTGTDKTKLDGIAAGAEVNVNADWNAASGDAQILNKPTSMAPTAHQHTDGFNFLTLICPDDATLHKVYLRLDSGVYTLEPDQSPV